MNETDDGGLAALMDRATRALEPPSADLVAVSLARGRRLRRRRQGAQLVSTVLLCGLVAAVSVLITATHSNGAKPKPAALRGAARTVTSTKPSPVTPTSRATGPGLTQKSVQQTFATLIPQAVTLSKRDGYTSPGSIGVTLTYDDHRGAVQMAVSVDYPPSGSGLGAACQISKCTRRPDGSTLAVYQGSDRPGEPALQPQEWEVILRRPDGTTVAVTEWNARTEKTASSVTRVRPPLTIEQVTSIVASPRWTQLDPP